MFVLGVLAIIIGAILTIVGFAMNNSLEAQLISAFSTGSTNPGNDIYRDRNHLISSWGSISSDEEKESSKVKEKGRKTLFFF